MSNGRAGQAAGIATAASAGTRPAALSASASAASTSSIAASQARPEVASAIAGEVRLATKRSEGKEDRLARRPLEPDVEVEDAAFGPGDQGAAAVGLDQRQDGIGGIRPRLVRGVDPWRQLAEKGPGED